MQWENLTSTDFTAAVHDTDTCILACGVIEKHSEHLPLGTDFINGHRLACLATEIEPAVVFPPFYFGQIYEARCFPGTVTIKPSLLLDLIESVMDEIGRNGFHKIILLNAHGGNTHLLPFIAQNTLWQAKRYSVYYYTEWVSGSRKADWDALLCTKNHGHACECETSISLANHPHLVKMERVPSQPADPLGRLDSLPANFSGISWYANYPDHYAGDARSASAEKGRALQDIQVASLAEYIRAVKADTTVPALNREFQQRSNDLGSW